MMRGPRSRWRTRFERLSFERFHITRRVSVRDRAFRVYAWHPRPWSLEVEPPLSWALERASDTDVFLDVGANRGYLALAFAAVTEGRVHAFEPHPRLVRMLEANVRLDPDLAERITVHELALGDSNGVAELHMSSVDPHTSLHPFNAGGRGGNVTQRTTVPTARLDTLVSDGRLPAPTHLKIDTEGHEVAVLEGAAETIAKHRPWIYTEVHPIAPERTNETAIVAFLEKHDYCISRQGIQLLAEPREVSV